MAVMPMKRISIYALKNRRKQILELIQRRGVVEIDDRKAAIKYCIENAKKGDMIVLLGKGHEDYQEIIGVRRAR